MPLYYFDLHDGSEILDQVGVQFATVEEARHHAVIRIAELLMQSPAKFWAGDTWTLTVKDDVGLVLFTLNFSATEAAVVGGQQHKAATG